jgi:signal transduction histidine kinase
MRTAALEQANRTRERLERELLDIAASERNAIGRELHDDLCQHLVGTAFATKVLAEHLSASRAEVPARDAQSIVGYVEEGIAKTRQLARGLLLASIEPANLAGELAGLAMKGCESGVACRFRVEGRPVIADAATAAQLFRIAQEAMRNALRHSDPKRVDIVLAGSDEATFLMVHDDGRGLPPPDARNEGLGLQIMEHRAMLIGGTLSVIPASGEGTRVICHIPLSAAVSAP